MAKTVTIQLHAGRPERIDGLCTTCWKPALIRIPISHLTENGVTSYDWTGCYDCRKRTDVS